MIDHLGCTSTVQYSKVKMGIGKSCRGNIEREIYKVPSFDLALA